MNPALHRLAAIALSNGLGLCSAVAAAPPEAVSPATLALHQRLLVLDSHLDTPMHMSRPGWDILTRHDYATDGSQVDLPRMCEGGLDGGFWAIYTPPALDSEQARAYASHYGLAVLMRIHDLLQRHPEHFALALSAQDAHDIAAAGKRVVFISMENADPLVADPGLLHTYHRQGLRMLGLVHFTHNELADSATAPARWNGLSPKGRDLVQAANRLGIVLDVSHASDAVFDQVLELSSAPIVASHSSARAITPHPRNLDDERLRKLAAKGGVVQVNSYSDYLLTLAPNPERDQALAPLYARYRHLAGLSPRQMGALRAQIEQVNRRYRHPKADFEIFMRHLLHTLDVVGPEHVGIGPDWDGGGGVTGMEDITQLPRISERLLQAGYSEKDLANIWSGNLLRVVQAAQDAAPPPSPE